MSRPLSPLLVAGARVAGPTAFATELNTREPDAKRVLSTSLLANAEEEESTTAASEPISGPPLTMQDNLTRTVHILGSNFGAPDNSIKTSMYTMLTFPTIGVLETLYPWNKFANFYFLMVGLVQMVKSISLTGGQPSSFLTLTFIVCCELFFKGKEDLRRHRADHKTNGDKVQVLANDEDGPPPPASADTPAGYVVKKWADVKVGDVVRVRSRETFPADLLLLRGSDPPGQCWVNTKPLDGETDTKLRLAPKLAVSLLEDPSACEPANLKRILANGVLRCEEANDKVNDITAQLKLEGKAPQIVSEDNFLLRGCQLRNTDWVLALVTTTGVQTKINYTPGAEKVGLPQPFKEKVKDFLRDLVMGNGPKPKVGRISKMVNTDIIGVVIWLIVMCMLGGFLYVVLDNAYAPGVLWYLEEDTDAGFTAFIKYTARYFLICYQFIPISLYVSMMFFQTVSRVFVANEVECYDAEQDEPCQVRQMSLLDELGQVSHIFSDKTGTLTSNHMEFRRCYVVGSSGAGAAYGSGETAISKSIKAMSRREGGGGGGGSIGGGSSGASTLSASAVAVQPLPPSPTRPALPSFVGCKEASRTYCNYEEAPGAPSLFAALSKGDADAKLVRELMLSLALNHSVLLESVNGRLELSASSPDEQAFVAAAEYFGFEFVKRDADKGQLTIVDKMTGLAHDVELLYAFPYESSRKRMSVMVRLPPQLIEAVGGEAAVRLYTKGADSVLCDLTTDVLARGSRGADPTNMKALDDLLAEWANIALRTLVFAKHEMPDFEGWKQKYDAACAEPENIRKVKLKEENEITSLQAQVESGLTLMGATAIEDKLQDGVPEILADLREAGIKVWMLTGDKVGTAKNIATACNILPTTADVLEITCETYPILAELKTSALLAVEKSLELAKAEASQKASNGASLGVNASLGERALAYVRGWLNAGAGKKAARDAYLESLEHYTKKLDLEYPGDRQNGILGLSAVRRALDDRRVEMQRAGDGRQITSEREFCLVLDEKAIEYCALLCKEVLAAVGHGSRSVVACRARKDQKALLLTLIRESVPSSCCLAIGDGANDVAMIKAGHIGVGIIGKEGMQAVNNSDFAIGQFRFLRHLLFVHGRYAYKRTCLFCYYMFYKNVVNVLAMYAYTMMGRVSGVRLFVQSYLEGYNMLFTAFPIILFCVFDQDVDKEVSARSPKLYKPGIMRIYYTHTGFVKWMIETVYVAILVTYLPALALGYPGASLSAPENGDPGVNTLSMATMILVCLVVNLRLAIELNSWHVLEHLVMWLTVAMIEIFALIFSYVWYPQALPESYDWNQLHGVVREVWNDLAYWLVTVLVIFLALLPRTLGKAYDQIFAGAAQRRFKRLTITHHKNERAEIATLASSAAMALPESSRGSDRVEFAIDESGRPSMMAEVGSPAPPPPPMSSNPSFSASSTRNSSARTPQTAGRQSSGFAFSNHDLSSERVLNEYSGRPLPERDGDEVQHAI